MSTFTDNGGSNGGSYASYYSMVLTVNEGTVDNDNNRSYVSWSWVLYSGSSGLFSNYSGNGAIYINGVLVGTPSGRYSLISHNSSLEIASGGLWVNHNSDGSKTISVSASMDFASGTYSPRRFCSKW